MMGFKLIGEMTKPELVDELAAWQRIKLEELDADTLRMHVVDLRVTQTRDRLEREANITVHRGAFGQHVEGRCDDE